MTSPEYASTILLAFEHGNHQPCSCSHSGFPSARTVQIRRWKESDIRIYMLPYPHALHNSLRRSAPCTPVARGVSDVLGYTSSVPISILALETTPSTSLSTDSAPSALFGDETEVIGDYEGDHRVWGTFKWSAHAPDKGIHFNTSHLHAGIVSCESTVESQRPFFPDDLLEAIEEPLVGKGAVWFSGLLLESGLHKVKWQTEERGEEPSNSRGSQSLCSWAQRRVLQLRLGFGEKGQLSKVQCHC